MRALTLAALACLWACLWPCLAAPARAGETLAAVASNFAGPMEKLEAGFEAASGHELTVSLGATGALYAQIVRGAPFDMLLAADAARPERLEASGRAVAGSRFAYAAGGLVLWSADPMLIGADGEDGADGAAILRAGKIRRLAVADPDLAPYGAAAMEVLAGLGLDETLRSKIVTAGNIGQSYAMVASGAAELGFLARSQIVQAQGLGAGSRWVVPPALHAPIRQEAVLLARGADNEAARAFLAYLKSEPARRIIEAAGYDVE